MDSQSAKIGYGGPEDRPVVAPATEYDLVGNMMAYESGELSKDETITLFQHLVDTGLAWSLNGSYVRAAHAMIVGGYIKAKA